MPRASSLVVFSLLALLAACRPAAEPPAAEIRPVRVMTVAKTTGGETVSVTGNVQAQTEVNLAFRIDGRMIQRNVNVGDVVKPGQVIATLNADNEENALQSARAGLAAASAQLVEARNNYDRYKTLLAQRFIAEAEFDRHAAILKTAQSAVDSAQAQVNIAQNRLGYAQLVADAGGTVTTVGAEPGEVVQAGRMIVQIARQGGRDAVFDVPPQIKDRAPADPEITVSLTDGSEGDGGRPRARGLAPRRSGHRDLQGQGRTHQSARGDAPWSDRDRAHAARQRGGHRDPGFCGDPGRPAAGRVGRRSHDRNGSGAQHRSGNPEFGESRCRNGAESGRRRRDRRRPGAAARPEGPPARGRAVIGPNLSEWALSKRSLVVFLMIVAVVAGTLAFLRLGRGEDPAFTFRTMVVAAGWPGATVEETLLQVTERLERKLQETNHLDTRAQLHHGRTDDDLRRPQAVDAAGRGAGHLVPGAQEHRRHPPARLPPASSARSSTTISATPSASSTASPPTASRTASCATTSRRPARGCCRCPTSRRSTCWARRTSRSIIEFSTEQLAGLGIDYADAARKRCRRRT